MATINVQGTDGKGNLKMIALKGTWEKEKLTAAQRAQLYSGALDLVQACDEMVDRWGDEARDADAPVAKALDYCADELSDGLDEVVGDEEEDDDEDKD